jgi:hypothetical protein
LERGIIERAKALSYIGKERYIHMLMAMLEGLIFFAILLAPTAIVLGIGYIIIKKEGRAK